jgi:hypothetical protein
MHQQFAAHVHVQKQPATARSGSQHAYTLGKRQCVSPYLCR